MRRRSPRPEIVFFATLCVVATVASAWIVLQLRFCLAAQRDWGRAPARVLEARSEELVVPRPYGRSATRRMPELFYAYEVAGRELEGRAIAPLWLSFLASERYHAAALAGLAPGAETTVRYDPADPGRSYLTLAFDRWLVFSLLALASGTALLCGGAWLRAVRGEAPGGRLAAPWCAWLGGAGALALGARYASWGEWALEAWLFGAILLGWGVLAARRAPREVVASA